MTEDGLFVCKSLGQINEPLFVIPDVGDWRRCDE
jgi:hypothetical protein